MDIGLYEEWMRPQVSKMFSDQYGVKEEAFTQLIENFYEHPFQKNKCIRIIAKEGKTVTGFQSFFYWPYELNGKTYNSYQSGNSLVHPNFRGKGIFQKLLDYLENHRTELGVDFLIGFPIEVSKGSLLRNKWKNVLNLSWYIKVINPLAFLFPVKKKRLHDTFQSEVVFSDKNQNSFRLTQDPGFLNWRKKYSTENNYFNFTFKKDTHTASFILKLSKRNFFINELTIGDIQYNSSDPSFLSEGIHVLISNVRSIPFITILTIALNEKNADLLLSVLPQQGFRKINKQIFFMVKSFQEDPEIYDPKFWTLYRSDIDTW